MSSGDTVCVGDVVVVVVVGEVVGDVVGDVVVVMGGVVGGVVGDVVVVVVGGVVGDVVVVVGGVVGDVVVGVVVVGGVVGVVVLVGGGVGSVVVVLDGGVVGEVVDGAEVGEPVDDARVSCGASLSTGAQAVVSAVAAAFMAARACCIGPASGMAAAPPELRAPAAPVDPVDPVDPADPADPAELVVGAVLEGVPVLLAADDPAALLDPADVPVALAVDAPLDPAPVAAPLPVAAEVVVVWSVVSWACAWSREACASVSAACNGVWSMVASCCPGVTVSPTLTRTPVTVPLTGNAAATWDTRLTVPVMVRVWATEPVDAAASR